MTLTSSFIARFVALLLALVAAVASGWQYSNWSQLQSQCPKVKQTREALVPPVDIRWGDEASGLRLGTVSGDLNIASLDELPLFFENTSSSFQVLDCKPRCRFSAYHYKKGVLGNFSCQPQLLKVGSSQVERFGILPPELVVFPPHSVSRLRFDGFGEQMFWRKSGGGSVATLDRTFVEFNASGGQVDLLPTGAAMGPRLILWHTASPDDD